MLSHFSYLIEKSRLLYPKKFLTPPLAAHKIFFQKVSARLNLDWKLYSPKRRGHPLPGGLFGFADKNM
jgi:hypothetical protein